MTDPYTILGLQRGATEDEAKTAFRALAKTCHPDLHPNDPDAERRFKEINAAYDDICKGNDKIETVQFRTGDFRFDDMFFNNHPFGDMFREMRRRNNDTNLIVKMTLEEAFHGKEYTISIQSGSATKTTMVKVPAGIMNGMRVHVPGGGNQPNLTLPAGDLFVNIRVAPHERFHRDNHNLVIMIPVSVFDVLLKKDIEVVNIEGRALNVGLSGSKTLRLAGQGMPDPLHAGLRGDLLVELFVQYPELTADQIDLIRHASEQELSSQETTSL
jgi:DnaJ-class molecular chaperone